MICFLLKSCVGSGQHQDRNKLSVSQAADLGRPLLQLAAFAPAWPVLCAPQAQVFAVVLQGGALPPLMEEEGSTKGFPGVGLGLCPGSDAAKRILSAVAK